MLFALFSFLIMVSEKTKKDLLGKFLLLVTTLIWGSSFIVLKDTLDKFGNGHFTFFVLTLRFGIAAVVILFFAVKKFKTAERGAILRGIILGVILFGAYSVQTLGLKYTTPSKNAFLTVSYCIIVPFASWLILKKRPEPRRYVAAALCLIGIALVALVGKNEKGQNEVLGDALSLGCGIFYAMQIIFIDKYAEKDDAVVLLFFEILTVAVLCAAVSFAVEFPKHYAEISFGFTEVWKILYLALFATCFTQFAQIYGQKLVSPMSAALVLSLEGVFSVLFEIIFGMSKITLWIGLGFGVIFISQIVGEVDFVSIIKARKNNEK